MMKPKLKSVPSSTNLPPAKTKPVLTGTEPLRYGDTGSAPATIPYTIHAPASGDPRMSDRAYILINVLPGQTSYVVKALAQIKEIKTIDPCWGKPDIIVVVEVRDQDALTQLVLSRIHGIEGVTQTDTHLVYRLKEAKAK
ncbi:MAG TPA: Lrp/AsnC ligand binding domain-containing protein [Nitrospira sp.]|jgi:nitrate reductase NapAB chaperone NapD|nr:Lrp/AsnC ligand binding domain-containing protein [Nitrospira sp.]